MLALDDCEYLVRNKLLPDQEFWEMTGFLWEGSSTYQGDCRTCMYLDPHTVLQQLVKTPERASTWALRMNCCALLLKQLIMLEIYGGSTINIREIMVSEYVLPRILARRQRPQRLVLLQTRN